MTKKRFATDRSRFAVLGLLLAAIVSSCMRPPNVSTALSGSGLAPGRPGTTLTGHVDFGFRGAFTTQATMSDVANSATVTLLDQSSGKSLATTLTDSSGNFNLALPNFTPSTASYYLEAFKGLNSNAANNDAIRVRTLLQFLNGGWESMTNTVPNTGISLDVGTTALSIITSLRAGSSSPVNTTYVSGVNPEIGTINPMTTPAGFAPVSLNVTAAEYSSVYNLIDQAFGGNRDPFETITYNSGTGTYAYASGGSSAPAVTSISPTSGPTGTAFTLTGTGFDPTLSNDIVKFSAGIDSAGDSRPPISATLTSGTTTSLSGTVPTGSLTGQVTLQVGSVVALGPTFSVTPTLTSFSPSSGVTGTSVTLVGTGFDPGNTTVVFTGGATASVTASSATSLTVMVPTTAQTGTLTVTTSGGSVTSATSFTVIPQISSMPSAGGPSGPMTITGSGFGATQGSSTVTFNGTAYTPTSWTPTTIVVNAPATLGSYTVGVTVGGTASNTRTFYVWNWIDGGQSNFDSSGRIYWTEYGTQIQYFDGTTVSNLTNSTANGSMGEAFGPDGNLWVSIYGPTGSLQKVTVPGGVVTTVLSNLDYPAGLAWTPTGKLCIAGTVNIYEYDIGTGALTTLPAPSNIQPIDPVSDASGNLYVQDYGDSNIYEVPASGSDSLLTTLPAVTTTSGLTIDPSNNLYAIEDGTVYKFAIATPGTHTTWQTGLYGNGFFDLSCHGGYVYGFVKAGANYDIDKFATSNGAKTLFGAITNWEYFQ